MGKRIELSGLSGRTYDFALLADAAVVPPQAANVVVAERKRGRWRVLYLGQTDYLPRKDWAEPLERIRATTKHVELLYRLNIAHAVREAEAEDIRLLHQPPGDAADAD